MKLSFKGKDPTSISRTMQKLMGLDEADYFLKIEKVRKIRSMNAERYYRGVVLKMIADEQGEIDYDYVHDYLGEKFKPRKRIKWPDGKVTEEVMSNADLDSKDFAEYVSKCRHFASTELNCFIPSAGELTNEQYEEIQRNKFY